MIHSEYLKLQATKVQTKGQRFVHFINNKSEVIFKHTIYFISYGDLDFFLSASNEIITEMYNSLEGVMPTDELYAEPYHE